MLLPMLRMARCQQVFLATSCEFSCGQHTWALWLRTYNSSADLELMQHLLPLAQTANVVASRPAAEGRA